MSVSSKRSKKETKKILKEMLNADQAATKTFEEIFETKTEPEWNREHHEKSGDSLLHIACKSDLPNLVTHLIAMKADVHWKNKEDRTPLHNAAQYSLYKACEMLLNEGADVNALKRGDWTPLMLTCTNVIGKDSLKTVQLLLEHNADVNYSNKDGWSALHLACRAGDSAVLNELLKYGVRPFTRTNNGRTALHIAALHGNMDIVLILLGLGFDPDDKDNCGNTALHEAVLGNNVEVCRLLIKSNASPRVTNSRGYSILHMAASAGYLVLVEFILSDLSWDINEATTVDGFTAFHCAAKKGHTQMIQYLKSKGADGFIKDKFGRDGFSYI